jgi:ankyrin repeat protein
MKKVIAILILVNVSSSYAMQQLTKELYKLRCSAPEVTGRLVRGLYNVAGSGAISESKMQPDNTGLSEERQKELDNLLREACLTSDLPAMRSLLDQRADVKARFKSEMTLLHCAGTSESVVRFLAGNGADMNAIDINGETPLSYHVRNLKEHVTPQLVATYVSVGAQLNKGVSWPLHSMLAHLATYCEQRREKPLNPVVIELIKQLLLLNAPVCRPLIAREIKALNYSMPSPLFTAAILGDTQKVEKMLSKKGYNPNVPDDKGLTPFHFAIARGHENVVRVLISQGAKFEHPVYGIGAELLARANGHEHIVKLLRGAPAQQQRSKL